VAAYRARLAAAALCVLAVWEIGVLVRVGREAAAPADWRAAAAAVGDALAPGDLIVFAPRWVDPVGRRFLGAHLAPADAARMDAARYPRVWEVSVRGAAAPEAAGAEPVLDERFGRVRVRRLERHAPRVTWDLRPHAAVREIAFEPRHCVLAPLRADAPERRLVYERAPLGDALHVAAGLAGWRARRANRATARLEVHVDGRPVTSALLDGASGWVALPPASTAPGPATVELRVAVEHWREPVELDVCIAAEARSAP
jgi:hypothetical protein